ncbi:hypothetical protein [Ectobacillus ponti]|uniref:Uncharacterized protein n=1 Tax=Ectobacillus ponti TaxID=2961894 RepID=A0AA42BRN4_9BACI|nr:hypothetical protein [Ectobacillus ponti]MCP8970571.1 hypothetical protein [Ectobacillus ponti]
MADLTPTVINPNASSFSATLVAAAAGGDTFINDGKTVFRVKNAGGSAVTVTFSTQSANNHGFKQNLAVTVPATSGDVLVGLFDPERFNDSNGRVNVSYSAVTSVTVAPISLGYK